MGKSWVIMRGHGGQASCAIKMEAQKAKLLVNMSDVSSSLNTREAHPFKEHKSKTMHCGAHHMSIFSWASCKNAWT